jgi:hypothetical protein
VREQELTDTPTKRAVESPWAKLRRRKIVLVISWFHGDRSASNV